MEIFTHRAFALAQTRLINSKIYSLCVKVRLNDNFKRRKTNTFSSCNRCSFCQQYHTSATLSDPTGQKTSKRTHIKENKDKQLQELRKSMLDDTPSVVKMMLEANPNDEDGIQEKYLSKGEIKEKLTDLEWDFKALHQKSKLIYEESLEAEDIDEQVDPLEDESIPGRESEYIESIFLDENRYQPDKKKKSSLIKLWGTQDASVPISEIPCLGCGAKLHCANTAIPGYMPSEKFKSLSVEELKKSVCQRCYVTEHHKVCLQIRATEDEFEKIITKIKNERALVLVLIDVSDIQNSMIKGLTKLIGDRRPLIIIGNKVDLIPRDSHGYLARIKDELMNACRKGGLVNKKESNIKHVHLISAKTGYGVESLITELMLSWKLQGQVYLVGNTNTGKSTFFNTLLMSDYCKASVREAVHRATVSVWPGTTISLLKFPIVNPTPWRLTKRKERILKDRTQFQEEQSLHKSKIRDLRKKGAWQKASLRGFVGCTDFRGKSAIEIEEEERDKIQGYSVPSFEFSGNELEMKSGKQYITEGKQEIGFDDTMFKMSRWLYDTPGVINNDQVINILNPEELNRVLPATVIEPRIFILKQRQVMFVSGLSRIDYIEGDQPVYINVFTAKDLKVHILNEGDADQFYQDNIGTDTFGVPLGDQERLNKLPSLIGKEFSLTGIYWKTAVADIQLSSLGWFSVTIGNSLFARLRVYTPGGRGMYLRQPSILPNILSFQGKRIPGQPRFITRLPKLN